VDFPSREMLSIEWQNYCARLRPGLDSATSHGLIEKSGIAIETDHDG